jgi:hypothetical protein
MSSQVTENFSQQYASNVFHLSQQKGSRLRGTTRNESQTGKRAYYDRLGAVAAQKKTGRHSSTPQLDTPHSRRAVDMDDYEWADLVDDQDKIRMLHDPTSEYAIAAMWAMGRSMDDVIVAALGGTSYAGETGGTSVDLANGNKLAANTGSALSDLNVKTLRAAKRMLDAAEVDKSIKRYFVCSSKQIESLLGQTEVTSSDYNTVKALVQGDVNTFMGFEFIQIERLSTQVSALSGSTSTGAVGSGSSLVGARQCYAYAGDGALLAIGADMKGRISERDDKSYATQVYACMSIGGTRMEENKVVQVLCTES